MKRKLKIVLHKLGFCWWEDHGGCAATSPAIYIKLVKARLLICRLCKREKWKYLEPLVYRPLNWNEYKRRYLKTNCCK